MKKLFTFLYFILFPVFTFAQLNGTYYIGGAGTNPNGGDPQYATLKAAVDDLNLQGISGPCTFYFTESKTYTESGDISLGCAGTSSTNTITFKPWIGTTPIIEFTVTTIVTGVTGSIDGHFVIGSPTAVNTNLVSTNYVTFDGSNLVGGKTRDLTINGALTSTQKSVFRIYGNNDNITIKNCIIKNNCTSGNSNSTLNVTDFYANSTNYTPDNLTIDNDSLLCTSATATGLVGVYISNSGSPTVTCTNVVIKNSYMNASQRGVCLNYVSNADVFGNTISLIDQRSAGAGAGIIMMTGGSAAGTFNIYNNKLIKLKTPKSGTLAASDGVIGIDNQLSSPKIVNIFNNFIYGFELTSSSVTNAKVYGIRTTNASTCNIYHNSIYMPDLTDMTSFGSSLIAGIAFATAAATELSPTGKCSIKNNIICLNESSMKVWGIRRVGTGGTYDSDGNNIYYNSANSNGFTGFYNAADQKSLDDWKLASGNDAQSKDLNPAGTFGTSGQWVSATNLHWFSKPSDDFGAAAIGSPVLFDIDGETRDLAITYKGADELPSSPLPVELTSFNALSKGSIIELKWNTATEVNTAKFEIERKSIQSEEWKKIGEINAHGNSNSPKQYSFVDNSPLAGKNVYRLKMIDNDGSFEYSSIAEVNFAVSQKPDLLQNYPNPFNPETVIRFSLPEASTVSLKIYNSIGEEVAELVNGHMDAGIHNVTFNASNLASGVYLYKLQTENFVKTMKMQLVK